MTQTFMGRLGETPELEDRALFKTYGGPIEIEVVPCFERPRKHLFMARGFFQKDTEVVVIISGRRALESEPLARTLKALENLAMQRATAQGKPPPLVDKIRLPVQIKGAWLQKIVSGETGAGEVKIHQLLVARWAFNDLLGQGHQFGDAPAFDVQTRKMRAKSRILQHREIDAVPRDWRPRPNDR